MWRWGVEQTGAEAAGWVGDPDSSHTLAYPLGPCSFGPSCLPEVGFSQAPQALPRPARGSQVLGHAALSGNTVIILSGI